MENKHRPDMSKSVCSLVPFEPVGHGHFTILQILDIFVSLIW